MAFIRPILWPRQARVSCTIPSRDYGPEYGRESAGGVCPCTKAGLPCDVMVTLLEVKPDALAVMTLVPE